MMEDVKQIILDIGLKASKAITKERAADLPPKETDEYLMMLSSYSAFLEEELGNLEMLEAEAWPKFRELSTSNADADRNWKSTTEGLKQIKLKRELNAVDKLIAALKAHGRRLYNEALGKS